MVAALVSPKWLHEELSKGNPNLKVIDCTLTAAGLGDKSFKEKHIEGAQFLNPFKHTTPTQEIPVNLPDILRFQEYLRSLGINASSHVILYENTDLHGFTGPRMWWLLRTYGFHNVSLLDGGLKKWTEAGYPVTDKHVEPKKGDVTLTMNKDQLTSYSEVIDLKGVQLVDTRMAGNFSGQEPEPSALLQAFMPALGMSKEGLELKPGHIPGAVNVPYPSMYQEDGVTFKPKEDLIKLFQNQGVDLKGKITASCYVGLTACIFIIAARACGMNDVILYPGSWVEYGQKASKHQIEVSD